MAMSTVFMKAYRIGAAGRTLSRFPDVDQHRAPATLHLGIDIGSTGYGRARKPVSRYTPQIRRSIHLDQIAQIHSALNP